MKLLLALAALCTTLLISQQTFAQQASKCLCYTSIGMDSGHTGRQCNYSGGENCACVATELGCIGAITQTSSTCAANWHVYGVTATGLYCCVKGCRAEGQEVQKEEPQLKVETTTTSEDLATVYGAGSRAAWYGYDDGVNKSPSAGRSNAQAARLDACMGHSTVTNYTVGNQQAWNTCNSDCDTATNGHCDDSGSNNGSTVTAFRCKDRCDCHIGNFNGSTCENL